MTRFSKFQLLPLLVVFSALCTFGQVRAKVTSQVRAGATQHSVVLNWTASTVAPGAPPVTSYNVYRGTTTGGETLLASAGNATTYTDTAVVAGTSYVYQVTAVNSANESPKSNEVAATIPNAVAPNAPVLASPIVQ
jgi:fibronectin type 3 domain-containing protein